MSKRSCESGSSKRKKTIPKADALRAVIEKAKPIAQFSVCQKGLYQLCRTRGTVEGFVRPNRFCRISSRYILTTSSYFDNLKFDIFDAGGPDCHFITSVLRAG